MSTFLMKALGGWPLKAGLSAGLILILGSTLNWPRVGESLLATEKQYVVAAFLILALTPLLTAERWRNASLAANVPVAHHFFVRATYAAVFAGQFLPAGIGVDAARIALLWQQRLSFREALKLVVLDRWAGVTAIFILMIAGVPFAIHLLPQPLVAPMLGLGGLLVLCCIALLFADRLPAAYRFGSARIDALLGLVGEIRRAIMTLHATIALAYGIGLHVLSIFAVLLLAQGFGYQLQFRELLFVVSVAIFAALLPVSFNGWGVREGAMVLALPLLGVQREAALMISLLFGLAMAIASLPGSVAWYRIRQVRTIELRKRRRENEGPN